EGAMGLFRRVNDIISANLNDMMERYEDPEKMLRQAVREMEEAIAVARKETAQAMASGKLVAKGLADHGRQGRDWQGRAGEGGGAGGEGGAGRRRRPGPQGAGAEAGVRQDGRRPARRGDGRRGGGAPSAPAARSNGGQVGRSEAPARHLCRPPEGGAGAGALPA